MEDNLVKSNTAGFPQYLCEHGLKSTGLEGPRQRAALSVTEQYALKHSAILDSGTTDHVFNELSRFLNFSPALEGDYLWAGDAKVPILGYC